MKNNGDKNSALRNIWDKKLDELRVNNKENFCEERLQRRLNSVLNIVNGKTKSVKDDLAKKIAEVLGITEETFQAQHADACRHYHDTQLQGFSSKHEANDASVAAASATNNSEELENQPELHQQGTTKTPFLLIMFLTLAALAALMVALFAKTEIFQKKEFACTVMLKETLNRTIECPNIDGRFEVSGPLTEWHTMLSFMNIPPEWDVRAFYATWLEPDYATQDPDRSGFVPLIEGSNHLDTQTYRVYKDIQLEKYKKDAAPNELNNRIQYLVVVRAVPGKAVFKEDDTVLETKTMTLEFIAEE